MEWWKLANDWTWVMDAYNWFGFFYVVGGLLSLAIVVYFWDNIMHGTVRKISLSIIEIAAVIFASIKFPTIFLILPASVLLGCVPCWCASLFFDTDYVMDYSEIKTKISERKKAKAEQRSLSRSTSNGINDRGLSLGGE